MGYVSVDESKSFHVSASIDVWLWVIIAFPLIAVALSVLVICEFVGRGMVGKATVQSGSRFANVV